MATMKMGMHAMHTPPRSPKRRRLTSHDSLASGSSSPVTLAAPSLNATPEEPAIRLSSEDLVRPGQFRYATPPPKPASKEGIVPPGAPRRSRRVAHAQRRYYQIRETDNVSSDEEDQAADIDSMPPSPLTPTFAYSSHHGQLLTQLDKVDLDLSPARARTHSGRLVRSSYKQSPAVESISQFTSAAMREEPTIIPTPVSLPEVTRTPRRKTRSMAAYPATPQTGSRTATKGLGIDPGESIGLPWQTPGRSSKPNSRNEGLLPSPVLTSQGVFSGESMLPTPAATFDTKHSRHHDCIDHLKDDESEPSSPSTRSSRRRTLFVR
ncbi:uncharacterized protein L969DRAFT_16688 [Mixia osmundae IAM 14324]|uniref:uncharacterized protein n=1 Tax=Mixia osmundae (strain CBS 9802 / IAM 14324 / JCM 22182 / KY 12970) TaxID=764103 RepID=UPI0004A550FF|nr:uncharacterized protein L969DRAFT_16688 [Mixia osmundae IAM 14324]KEI40019.1 hypothetical protein L969DRAFT_16688 [Mixia osmundae IAM 14324]